ncbi:hypothetical protein C772_01698 [Bhargavaea cecembensis DSE10]|uniref:Uncharacterized protein n=1 Tax=Bhargavaea cecembensis DSE10 TaxID=1235279 RepID=M7NGQ6_9BACL|nr:hypothetical protein [Bhargavaea cecembensis]EMR06427.1 hypothetical protein C772_01698 [Bhargavaea cecembensis DSE10]
MKSYAENDKNQQNGKWSEKANDAAKKAEEKLDDIKKEARDAAETQNKDQQSE